MSSKSRVPSKSGMIQVGAVISAPYGPLDDRDDPDRKRKTRCRMQGVILSSYGPDNWIVYWFCISKCSITPNTKLKVESHASPVSEVHLKKLQADTHKDMIGGTNDLRNYVDKILGGENLSSEQPKKRKASPLPPPSPCKSKSTYSVATTNTSAAPTSSHPGSSSAESSSSKTSTAAATPKNVARAGGKFFNQRDCGGFMHVSCNQQHSVKSSLLNSPYRHYP